MPSTEDATITSTSSENISTRNATITALAFAGDAVLAGEGNILRVLQPGQGAPNCLIELPLFQAQAIHGLICLPFKGTYLVVAWGGRRLRTLLLDIRRNENLKTSARVLASRSVAALDWIIACRFREHADGKSETPIRQVAVVTAHNALLALKISVKQDDFCQRIFLGLTSLSAGSRVLLYAASLRWISASHIVIVAGSALGDIIVWSCHTNAARGDDTISSQQLLTHYNFSSHDGSVFGLDITVLRAKDGRDQLLLASCSDDRTIRIWDVSDALGESSPESNGSFQRDTELSSPKPQSTPEAPCLLKAWAHSSRIWQVAFLDMTVEAELFERQILSFGEDATCQLWSLSAQQAANSQVEWRLQHKETFLNHAGKNIWSQATLIGDGLAQVATGGADGGIVLVDVPRNVGKAQQHTIQQWHSDHFAEAIPTEQNQNVARKTALTAPKAYSFVSQDDILMTTPAGHVFIGKRSTSSNSKHEKDNRNKSSVSWNYVTTIPSLQSYSVTTGLPSHNIGFVGGANGDVYAFLRGKLIDTPILQVRNKVANLYIQAIEDVSLNPSFDSDEADSSSANILLLVARLGVHKASLHHFRSSISDTGPTLVETAPQTEFELPNDFLVTSMLYHQRSRRQDSLLFLGARNGKVACFALHDKPRLLACTQHHSDAVTCMKWMAETTIFDSTAAAGYLLTSGRDSSYAIHQYRIISNRLVSDIVHRAILPFGPNIEGFYHAKNTSNLIFYGFHSKDFVVYNGTKHTEVMRVECGGAHRVWAFQSSHTQDYSSSATFLWTRASALCMSSGSQTQRQWIEKGGHGREIKAVAVNPSPYDLDSRKCTVIATGAEDTDIRLFTLSTSGTSNDQDLKCISIISKHNTGLQQLKWSSDGRYLFSAGGCEELFIWRMREVPFVQIGVVCESALPPASELPDLRIMAFDVLELHGYHSSDVLSFLITIVLSDSTLRVYHYSNSPDGPSWQLLRDGRYTTCCLTQVLHLVSSSHIAQMPASLPLLTAGTDGRVSFWNVDLKPNTSPSTTSVAAPARPCHTITIHQNAITTAQLIPLPSSTLPASGEMGGPAAQPSEYLLVTGGDDNALAITRVSCTTDASPATSTLLIPRAHAAAVRSIAITSMNHILHDHNHDPHSSPTPTFAPTLPHFSSSQPPSTSPAPSHSKHSTAITIITSSNDQRLRTWHITLDLSQPGVQGLEVRRGRKWWSTVADVAGCDVLRHWSTTAGPGDTVMGSVTGMKHGQAETAVQGVLVCGVGMEVIDIRDS